MKKGKYKKLPTILPISIVIPAYSEETWLPILLNSIDKQIMKPAEIIVADADSPDKTREIALLYGAKVVQGGKISVGRNNGARAAKSDYLLFMDADTMLPTELSLGMLFLEFMKSNADFASPKLDIAYIENTRFGKAAGKVVYHAWNDLMKIQARFGKLAVAPGIAIITKKEVFNAIGGFDEDVIIGEDGEFFRTGHKLGFKYAKLATKVRTSVRRFDSPKKVAKLVPWIAFGGLAYVFGLYAGSKHMQNQWKWYGKLGGGEGKDPTKELSDD